MFSSGREEIGRNNRRGVQERKRNFEKKSKKNKKIFGVGLDLEGVGKENEN